MAFDQNSIPKDLRPLNVARSLTDETRIVDTGNVSATTGGRNPEIFTGPEGSAPFFYPGTAVLNDAGFVGLGYGNPPSGIPQWAPVLPMPVGNVNVGLNAMAAGFGYSPNLGNRVVVNAVDNAGNDTVTGVGSSPNVGNQVNVNGSDELMSPVIGYNPSLGNRGSGSGVDRVSEEGVDDSVSGKKVKFLCSFGGKIMPRPSDSMLRYVGGHTRIISVRRDVSFCELQQKMVDIYGQHVVIKYQLPDEDLDALVSVSCPDDLDHMMEEYEKLVERSDGSAKLRVFLFSASEVDFSGMFQFVDSSDEGKKYVDAVNGIAEGTGGLVRKESMTSATSTQNSDYSGTEPVDNFSPHPVDLPRPPSIGMLSTVANLATSHDSNLKLVSAEPAIPVYAETSSVSLDVPMVKTGPSQTLPSRSEVEFNRSAPIPVYQQQLGYDLQQPGACIPPSARPLQAYVDPRLPPQMTLANGQLIAAGGPVFTQQRAHENNTGVSPNQLIPAVHMTMNTSSTHATVRPPVVQQLLQPPQQTTVEHYSDKNAYGTRIARLHVDPRYSAYQAWPPPPAFAGGGYGRPQVPRPENVVFSDGSVPLQQAISRLEDCYMCQKALPHVHSDPAVLEQRESSVSSLSDQNSVHSYSLPLEDNNKVHPMTRVMTTCGFGAGNLEHSSASRPAVLETLHETDREVQILEISEQPKSSAPHGLMGLPGESLASYVMFPSGNPQPHPEVSVQHHQLPNQFQVNQELLHGRNINSDVPTIVGVPPQATEYLVHESLCKVPSVISKEDAINTSMPYDQWKPIEGMMGTLRISPPELNIVNEEKKSSADEVGMEDISDQRTQLLPGGEALLDNGFNKPQAEVLPSSAEVSYMLTSRPVESYEVIQQPVVGNPGFYPQTNVGIHLLDSGEVSYSAPARSALQPAYVTEKIPPAEWNSDASLSQPKIVPAGMEGISSNRDTPASLLPALGRVTNVQDTSNSLFSNQDPWNLRHDTHFPPPKPSKIATRKDGFGTRDPFVDNHFGDAGELVTHMPEESATQRPSNLREDFSSEHVRSSKVSAEDLVKQELKAVAEDVAASVFKSGTCNPGSVVHEGIEYAYEGNRDSSIADKHIENQHKAKLEDMKNKLPEKVNFGFPVSEGIGRLQIIKNSDLEELRELGSGTFGTVYHGKWRGTDVAIKRINDRCFSGKPSEQDRMIDDFWNEAIKLADLHHPNVVAFYGVVLDGPGGSVATVTEYMVNGSLRNALQKNERSLDKRKRFLISMDVAFGMEYLHGKNIVHFDLKSDNLLVNLRDPHRPICKVGDLGLSKVKCQTLISGGVRGTLPWMAPELLNGSGSLVSEKVDVFSFGIVLWELLTGEEPYADLHYGAIIGGIVSNTLRPPVPESCDPEWRSLMEKCWSAEPSERPSFNEIANELRAMASKIPYKGQNTSPSPVKK